LTHDSPLLQQDPLHNASAGQQGPPLVLIFPPGNAWVPDGQQRLTPTSLVQVRSGGQHADGAVSSPTGSAQVFGDAQHDPAPEPALQQTSPVAQHVLLAGSQQNVPLAQHKPSHFRAALHRFFLCRASATDGASRPCGPATTAMPPAARKRSAPRRDRAAPKRFASASNREHSMTVPVAERRLPGASDRPRVVRPPLCIACSRSVRAGHHVGRS
jgi:hypothetical protein